jgi:hypothetical protein
MRSAHGSGGARPGGIPVAGVEIPVAGNLVDRRQDLETGAGPVADDVAFGIEQAGSFGCEFLAVRQGDAAECGDAASG